MQRPGEQNVWERKPGQVATAVVQVWDARRSDQGGDRGGGRKWSDSEYILRVKLTSFAFESDVGVRGWKSMLLQPRVQGMRRELEGMMSERGKGCVCGGGGGADHMQVSRDHREDMTLPECVRSPGRGLSRGGM